MKSFLLMILCLTTFCSSINSQCLKIIGFNSDNPDQVLLEADGDIAGSMVFYLTDNEWNGTDDFNGGESTRTYTAPAAGIASGSTILISGTTATCGTTDGPPALANKIDEIYVTTAMINGTVLEADICDAIVFGGTGSLPASGVDLGAIDNAILSGVTWTTSNSIINLGLGSCTTLPVTIIDFSARTYNNAVNLNWTTASEINNDYFDVQRSSDGKIFETIGKVNGNGTTTEEESYGFVDRSPTSGVVYYRLAQYDYNGEMEYHKVISLQMRGLKSSIYPTMAAHQVMMKVEEPSKASIISSNGQLITSQSFEESGALDVSALPAGIYYLRIIANGSMETHRFIKE